MKSRFVFAALLGAVLVSTGAMHSAAQDGQKKAPVKTAPKKSSEQKQAPKKAAPKKTEQKKAEQKKEPQKKTTPGTPGLVAQYGDWGVYVNKTAKTCFALTQPKERQPANVKRGPAYFFVTTRPGEKLVNEISIMTGFALKEDAAVTLEAAGGKFPLYVKGNGLWIREPANEQKLLAALQQEKEVWLKLTPAKGAETNDRYSLTGLTQALERVAKECP
ncbi:MAG TPA: Invasion associated locus B family protein [Xanthobacteraceae bacterium]|nr:Invasion associated locus B family protein [Xanthobacteraceae bacterium]